MLSDLLTITDAAEYADVIRQTIYAWIYHGKRYRGRLHYLEAVTYKGKMFIRAKTLDAFLDRIGYEPADEEDDDE